MPLYTYKCIDCHTLEERIAGLDDHLARCVCCGGLMLRQDQDIFAAYFEMERTTEGMEIPNV